MQETNQSNPFYKMIKNLFLTNSLVLFGRIDEVTVAQEEQVIWLLEYYYSKEAIGYPDIAPPFDKEAAAWSSKILFYAAQLVMYREHSGDTLVSFFPTYKQPKSAAAIITVDLSLRFLPSILKYLEQIDIEDELIILLKEILREWHYSGLLSNMNLEEVDLELTLSDTCLRKLYVDRIIENKRKKMGQKEELKPFVLSVLGNYQNEFWKDFTFFDESPIQ